MRMLGNIIIVNIVAISWTVGCSRSPGRLTYTSQCGHPIKASQTFPVPETNLTLHDVRVGWESANQSPPTHTYADSDNTHDQTISQIETAQKLEIVMRSGIRGLGVDYSLTHNVGWVSGIRVRTASPNTSSVREKGDVQYYSGFAFSLD